MKINDNKTNIVGLVWVVVAFVSWKFGLMSGEMAGLLILHAGGVLSQAHKTEKGRHEVQVVNEKIDDLIRRNQS